MSNLIIGLTGGIGSGKTTVSNMFAALGITVVDADIVAREVVAIGSPALDKIATKFGNDILNADGSLNRTALREQIFSNEENEQWLNQLLHPIIRTSMLAQLSDTAGPYTILVAPLLFENKLESLVARTLVVDVPVEKQISRTLNRDQRSSEQVIKNIINSQIARTERLSKADDIIDNSHATIEQLTAKVKQLHQSYSALSLQK